MIAFEIPQQHFVEDLLGQAFLGTRDLYRSDSGAPRRRMHIEGADLTTPLLIVTRGARSDEFHDHIAFKCKKRPWIIETYSIKGVATRAPPRRARRERVRNSLVMKFELALEANDDLRAPGSLYLHDIVNGSVAT
ncbi:MAG TPA: hypothetical protein VFN54_10620 [Acidimicrobiales bacterium]|nr:hypothetical protein [Acidimicrobiales bacterium]